VAHLRNSPSFDTALLRLSPGEDGAVTAVYFGTRLLFLAVFIELTLKHLFELSAKENQIMERPKRKRQFCLRPIYHCAANNVIQCLHCCRLAERMFLSVRVEA
jgi:hypothetical protein